jgi:hypothetical protein
LINIELFEKHDAAPLVTGLILPWLALAWIHGVAIVGPRIGLAKFTRILAIVCVPILLVAGIGCFVQLVRLGLVTNALLGLLLLAVLYALFFWVFYRLNSWAVARRLKRIK